MLSLRSEVHLFAGMMGSSPLRGATSMILALLLLTHTLALGAAPSHEATSIGSTAVHREPRGGDNNVKAYASDAEAPHSSGGGSSSSSALSMGGSTGPSDGRGSAASAAMTPDSEVMSGATGPVVVVSGATGRTGSLLYLALRGSGIAVRALVRNASKAKEMLDCGACDEEAVSRGIGGIGG